MGFAPGLWLGRGAAETCALFPSSADGAAQGLQPEGAQRQGRLQK